MSKQPENYYVLLGIPRSATQDEIRRAYRKAAKRLHPDKNIRPGETELFMDVQQAYQVLSNPAQRAAYDATLLPEKEAPAVVNPRILVSRKTLSQLKETQLVYLLIDLSPSEAYVEESSAVPLNICLVLDCSTSMKGDNLDTVKLTASQLIHKLKPQDIFSIVSFNDRAEVILPATKQANPFKMVNRIQLLQASGGTEILKGLQTGLDEVKRYYHSKYINHIILLTDGHTYGDEPACFELAKEAASLGIGISALGIGGGWNDSFLDQLANLTGGHSMLVSQPQEIERLLTEKFIHLSNIFAESVTLEYELDEGIEMNYAFRLQPETDPLARENPLRLGPILQELPHSVLIEFIIHPQDVNTEFINLVHGKIVIAASGLDTPVPSIPINIVLPIKETGALETPPTPIVQALSKLTLYRLQEKARSEVAAGNYGRATEHLQRLATNLLSQGERSLAKTIILEIQNIESEKSYSEYGEKQIKYGTRALVLSEEKKS
jgi:Ca-activated chloride channel family protein